MLEELEAERNGDISDEDEEGEEEDEDVETQFVSIAQLAHMLGDDDDEVY